MPIRVLPAEVASQIAAGEVIERPASVVKELVENALDAGARFISVTIEETGKKLIEVADDGAGIPADELQLSVSRHATSKLRQAQDLFRISTLGFRGEALASIASVSRLMITSRVEQEREAARLYVEAGKPGKFEKVGAPVGTLVRVENLFFNIPARLKFLKTDLTERRVIDTLVTRYSLAYAQTRFKLSEGASTSLQTSGDGDRRAILAGLYGVETAKQMLEVIAEEEGMSLSGFVSPTSLTRSNRKEISFFVNGRWVQDIPLTTALLHAYHTLLMVGRYPLAVLFLDLPPEGVDVNVHPAKAEIRFRDQDRVFSFVQRAARRALLAYSPMPQVSRSLWGQTRGASDPAWQLAHLTESANPSSNSIQGSTEVSGSAGGTAALPTTRQAGFEKIPLLRLIGQIGATYLVAEGPDGLYLIDQHAAHERVLYEKLMTQRGEQKIASQRLLAPVVVNFPPAQAKLLDANLDSLQRIGFTVEAFGPGSFRTSAMPALFGNGDAGAALRAIVDDFEEDETPLGAEIERRLAGRVCKRMAVKAGQTLSAEEQKNLLVDLETCESPRTCPHGRPTMIHLSVDLLERQFGRRGAR